MQHLMPISILSVYSRDPERSYSVSIHQDWESDAIHVHRGTAGSEELPEFRVLHWMQIRNVDATGGFELELNSA